MLARFQQPDVYSERCPTSACAVRVLELGRAEFIAVLRLRIQIWIGGLVSRLVARLHERVRAALAEHGYR